MPQKYRVTDSHTGKTYTFDWHGDNAPSPADLDEMFASAGNSIPAPDIPDIDPRAEFGVNAVEDAQNIGKGLATTAGNIGNWLGRVVTPPTSVAQGQAQNADLANQAWEGAKAVGSGALHSFDWLTNPSQTVNRFQKHPLQTALDVATVMPIAGTAARFAGRAADVAAPAAYRLGLRGADASAVQAGLDRGIATKSAAQVAADGATAQAAAAQAQVRDLTPPTPQPPTLVGQPPQGPPVPPPTPSLPPLPRPTTSASPEFGPSPGQAQAPAQAPPGAPTINGQQLPASWQQFATQATPPSTPTPPPAGAPSPALPSPGLVATSAAPATNATALQAAIQNAQFMQQRAAPLQNLARSIPNQNFQLRPALNVRTLLGMAGYGGMGIPGAVGATVASSPIGLRTMGLGAQAAGQGLGSAADYLLSPAAIQAAALNAAGRQNSIDDWWSPRPQE